MEELVPCDANEAQVHILSCARWRVKLRWASPIPNKRNLVNLNMSNGWSGGGRGRKGGVSRTCGWFHSLHGSLVSCHCIFSGAFSNRRQRRSHAQVKTAHEFHIGACEEGWDTSLCPQQSICRDVETNTAIQTRMWQMGCMRRPSGVNELHSGSSGATPANRRSKRRSCCSTLFKSCVSTETEAAAAAAVWLCRRNFKNRPRAWGERRGRSASK